MEYNGQALQCITGGNNIAELIFNSHDESVNKFDKKLDRVITEKKI